MRELLRLVRRAAARSVRVYFTPVVWAVSRVASLRRSPVPPPVTHPTRFGGATADRVS